MPPAPPQAAAFAGALFASGYLFPLLKATEVVAGLLLLGGLFVPLALAVLAPIIINIVGFHLFLAPSGLPLPLAVLAAELYLAWSYRARLRAHAPPADAAAAKGGRRVTDAGSSGGVTAAPLSVARLRADRQVPAHRLAQPEHQRVGDERVPDRDLVDLPNRVEEGTQVVEIEIVPGVDAQSVGPGCSGRRDVGRRRLGRAAVRRQRQRKAR